MTPAELGTAHGREAALIGPIGPEELPPAAQLLVALIVLAGDDARWLLAGLVASLPGGEDYLVAWGVAAGQRFGVVGEERELSEAAISAALDQVEEE